MRKHNKAQVMRARNSLRLPTDFITTLHNEGKLTTHIHKALVQKGYRLHLHTLRKHLRLLGLDYRQNYSNWLTSRSKLSKNKKTLIRRLWTNGESIHSISQTTGLAFLTVRTYLHQLGFKTKLLQFYYSEPSNAEERMAKKHLEGKGIEVKKCFFLCQRKLEKPFQDILSDPTFPFPKDLRTFCKGCPIKGLAFEEQEMYDFVIKDKNRYGIVEVKKVYHNPYRRAHFTLGQFLNLPKIIKGGIPFTLMIFDNGKLHEKQF